MTDVLYVEFLYDRGTATDLARQVRDAGSEGG